MSSLSRVLLFLAVVGASLAAVQIGKADVRPGYEGKCYAEGIGAFSPGSWWLVPGKCVRRTCTEINNELYYEETGCGVAIPSDSCQVVTDRKKPHPECCPRLVCG
uniref:Single VWC domain protein 3 n=1 Tax=Penaeus japonicus TaxID=27405 RepID=A0A1L7NZN6_PENJP|nr:single VWC domain protein 3 [Penaeus japonicus]